MQIGMLWLDQSNRSLAERLAPAVEYFQRKYGMTADLCYVHSSMLDCEKATVGGISVRVSPTVLPNHFWVGRKEENDAQ